MYAYESWIIKKAEHQRTDALNCGAEEDFWESLGLQGVQIVHPKGDHSWVFIGMTDETLILWPPDAKNWLIWKDPYAGKDWRQEGKGATEDEMVGCIIDSMDMSLSKLRDLVVDSEAWHAAIHGVIKSQTWLNDWTELNWYCIGVFLLAYFTLYNKLQFHPPH